MHSGITRYHCTIRICGKVAFGFTQSLYSVHEEDIPPLVLAEARHIMAQHLAILPGPHQGAHMKTFAALLLITACSGTPATTARLAPSPWCRDVIPTQNNGETSIIHLGVEGTDWRIRVALKTANNGRTFGAEYYASGSSPEPHMKARMAFSCHSEDVEIAEALVAEGLPASVLPAVTR